jgi:GxxExxY protein
MGTDNGYIYKELTYKIIGAIYNIHKELGNVHKETIYHKAIAIELAEKEIPFEEEKPIDVIYKGKKNRSI